MLKRSRARRLKSRKLYSSLLSLVVLAVVTTLGLKFFGSNVTEKVAVADTKETSQSVHQQTSAPAGEVSLLSTKNEAALPSSETQPEVQPEEEIVEISEPSEEEVAEEAVVTEFLDNTEYVAHATSSYPTVLANGNSAGVIGTEAAVRMAEATGVPQETWEYIIARESNGDPNIVNPSGAAGLFQTIPGWGSTATVEDQINTAIHVYNNQGLAAWGMP